MRRPVALRNALNGNFFILGNQEMRFFRVRDARSPQTVGKRPPSRPLGRTFRRPSKMPRTDNPTLAISDRLPRVKPPRSPELGRKTVSFGCTRRWTGSSAHAAQAWGAPNRSRTGAPKDNTEAGARSEGFCPCEASGYRLAQGSRSVCARTLPSGFGPLKGVQDVNQSGRETA